MAYLRTSSNSEREQPRQLVGIPPESLQPLLCRTTCGVTVGPESADDGRTAASRDLVGILKEASGQVGPAHRQGEMAGHQGGHGTNLRLAIRRIFDRRPQEFEALVTLAEGESGETADQSRFATVGIEVDALGGIAEGIVVPALREGRGGPFVHLLACGLRRAGYGTEDVPVLPCSSSKAAVTGVRSMVACGF